MITVSDTWKRKIKEQFRYQGYLRMVVAVVPPGLPESAEASSEYTEDVATAENIVFGGVSTSKAVASFEPNRWLLDGSFTLLEDEVSDWWSKPGDYGYLAFKFDQEYSIPGFTFYWDEVNGTAPTSITLVGIDNNLNEVSRYTFDKHFEAVDSVEAPMENVRTVLLYVNQWRHSQQWRARIASVVFGLYATYDSINNGLVQSSESNDTADPLNRSLPTHTQTVVLRNLNEEFDPTLQRGISRYLAQRQLVQFQWGFTTSPGTVEWTPRLNYYISNFSIPADSKEVTLETTSKLAFLTQEYKLSKYDAGRRSLLEVAQEVLLNSRVIKESAKDVPWSLSSTLSTFYTTAPLPVVSTNALLQLIAGAGCCWLRTEPTNGSVQITDNSGAGTTTVDLSQQVGDPSIEIQELLHTVTIGVYKYTLASEVTELSKGDYFVAGSQRLELSFSAPFASNVSYDIQGATDVRVTQFEVYSSCVVMVVEAPADGRLVSIVLKGLEGKQSITQVQTYQNTTISQGLDIVIENPLITETERLQDLSDWIVHWYSKRQNLNIPYTGYPEVTAGDGCTVATVYSTLPDATVLSNKITFNGAFTGTLEVK